mmetsp:Transcript_4589/g.9686  ORF Transcript_4589/g.9686 Transcript_4589/m.9686 type:complete len:152 (-) Transcript_4589:280-735(-)
MTMATLALLFTLVASASTFTPSPAFRVARFAGDFMLGADMINIAEGVEYDTVSREWRCKWSNDDDMTSLVAAQEALNAVVDTVKAVDGVKSVERIVCGDCNDFKVVTTLPADKFGAWVDNDFFPEGEFLDMLGVIDGISTVETQTYTKMTC